MRLGLSLILVALACDAAPRIPSRACDAVARRSDRGGVACDYATGTIAAIASYASSACDCQQQTRNVCSAPAPGILVAERMTDNIPVGTQSPAYCTKRRLSSGIAQGDLVGCSTNTPRIRPANADGTGALGVMSEPGRWNFIAVSDQFENSGIWRRLFLPPSASDPVIVNGAMIGPDGTTSVDMAYFDSSSGVGESILYNSRSADNSGCPVDGGTLSASIYLAGAPDSGTWPGTLDLCTSENGAWNCTACTVLEHVADGGTTLADGGLGGWSRCLHENKGQDTTGGFGYFVVGNASFVNGGVSRPAQGVYLSKAQCEAGATATSPIDNSGSYSYRGPDTYSVQQPTCRAADARTAWLGDSLSGLWSLGIGYGLVTLTQRPPARYATATGRTVDNWAHQGDTLADAITQWSTYGDRSRAQRIVVWVGINDIVGGANGTTLASTFTTWADARIAEGRFLTILNVSPFGTYVGWSAPKQTQADAYAAALATYCAANPATTKCVDIRTPLSIDGGIDLAAPYSAGDGVHLNQAGATLVGDTVAAASP